MIGEDSALSEGRLGRREHRDLLYRNIDPRNAPCKRHDEELRIFFFLMFTDHTTTCFVPSSCDAAHKMRRIGCPGDRCRGGLQNGRRCRRSHLFAERGHGHKSQGTEQQPCVRTALTVLRRQRHAPCCVRALLRENQPKYTYLSSIILRTMFVPFAAEIR